VTDSGDGAVITLLEESSISDYGARVKNSGIPFSILAFLIEVAVKLMCNSVFAKDMCWEEKHMAKMTGARYMAELLVGYGIRRSFNLLSKQNAGTDG
jgi:hypothetical protein